MQGFFVSRSLSLSRQLYAYGMRAEVLAFDCGSFVGLLCAAFQFTFVNGQKGFHAFSFRKPVALGRVFQGAFNFMLHLWGVPHLPDQRQWGSGWGEKNFGLNPPPTAGNRSALVENCWKLHHLLVEWNEAAPVSARWLAGLCSKLNFQFGEVVCFFFVLLSNCPISNVLCCAVKLICVG